MSDQQLEAIGSYVKSHLPEWLAELAPERRPMTITDPALLERIVRVEESLSHQRELMSQGFAAMEKRFEQLDKRFEQVDKRFEDMREDMNARFEAVDKRFEAVDKRFEDMREDMNKRFQEMRTDMDARFRTTNRMIVAFFALVTVITTVVQFV